MGIYFVTCIEVLVTLYYHSHKLLEAAVSLAFALQ